MSLLKAFEQAPAYVLGLSGGFLLTGPALCLGMYRTSQRLENGEKVDWGDSLLAWQTRTGQLAITRREGFQMVYDLTERVIPAPLLQAEVSADAKANWACTSALDHLGFGSVAEIAAFWDALPRDATPVLCPAQERGFSAARAPAAR